MRKGNRLVPSPYALLLRITLTHYRSVARVQHDPEDRPHVEEEHQAAEDDADEGVAFAVELGALAADLPAFDPQDQRCQAEEKAQARDQAEDRQVVADEGGR